MRIALIGCSDEERTAIMARFEAGYAVAELPVGSPRFDLAILGSSLLPGGRVPEPIAQQVTCPAIAILPSAAFFDTFDADMGAITIDGLDRLPVVIRRELRHDMTEARYRDLVSQVPGVVWSSDENGRLLLVTDRIAEVTGYSREEFLAAGVEDFFPRIHEQDLVLFHELWAEMLQGNPLECDLRFLRKDGIWVWLHVRASLDRSQGVPRVVGVTTDVTDRRAAEDALRASEARYRTLVEGAQDVIVAIDVEGRVTSANRAAEELTGQSRVYWVGRSILEALGPESAVRAQAHFRATFAGAPAEQHTEYQVRTGTGQLVTMETQVRPVESHGKVVGIVIVARDVTARKEAHTRAEKEKRLASLGQLATSVAHEFNNVLMSIMPFAELLRRRMPDDERVITSTRHIIDAVRRGRDIAQEILRFARPVSPEIENIRVCEWMEDFARHARGMLGPLYTVDVELPSGELMLSADRALLDQVALNVVSNARDAMPDGGTFSIAARDGGEMVDLEFTDRGHGIA
ncbi:MAG TPA: PAS domain S-box protein, partial [Thermoanaerobaculia bacterium]|nr:PAS domain S-box protein [Thermoanaerobaculia bacterium]